MNNQQDPRRPNPGPASRFPLWYVLAAIGLMLVLQNLLFAQPFEQWPYSKFKTYLRDGRVAEVRIDSRTIRGKLLETESGGPGGYARKSFTTVRVDDPHLVSELEKYQVDYRGQYENDLLKGLLSWIVPLSLIFLLWMLISRRMGPGQGVMNFGKSRARIYAERETGVTFVDVAGVEEAK